MFQSAPYSYVSIDTDTTRTLPMRKGFWISHWRRTQNKLYMSCACKRPLSHARDKVTRTTRWQLYLVFFEFSLRVGVIAPLAPALTPAARLYANIPR